MKISLIAPSRGRPEKCIQNIEHWIDMSSLEHDIEVIISLDSDDPSRHQYAKELYELHDYKEKISSCSFNNTSVVDATNKACKISRGDILVYLSDDFKCHINWDEQLVEQFEGETRPLLVKVDDCLQPFDVAVLTIPIMNRALYERLGYFFHPEYKSMFCDEHLYWTVRKMGALKFAPHLKFPHEHVSIGKAQDDETYRRSAANWEQGKALFAKHKALGFPV